MQHYWSVLSVVVLPIIIICVFGALLQKWRRVDPKPLTDVSLFVLSPCLVLVVLSGSDLKTQNVMSIFWFTCIQTAMCWLLAKLASKVFKLEANVQSALTLTTLFGNANNYGLPVLLLAYGSTGLVNGAAYVIGQIILINTVGLYIASLSEVNPWQAIQKVLKTPLIYAVILGIACHAAKIHIPNGVLNGLQMLGNAYAAIVLLILGVQLGRIHWHGVRRRAVWIAIVLRLVIVPLLSELCILMLGIHGVLASILLVQSSMPAAINTIVIASQYGSDDEVVTLTVALSTVISFVTLPLLIVIGSGGLH